MKALVYKFPCLPLAIAAIVIIAPGTVAAQALQNNGGSVQPNTQQTQGSLNTQRNVATPQTNNSQTALNQNEGQPLGVVSDPQQTKPNTVVKPSNSLKADITKSSNSDNGISAWLIVAVFVALGIISAVALAQSRTSTSAEYGYEGQMAADNVAQTSLKKPKVKKVKKNRKKSYRR